MVDRRKNCEWFAGWYKSTRALSLFLRLEIQRTFFYLRFFNLPFFSSFLGPFSLPPPFTSFSFLCHSLCSSLCWSSLLHISPPPCLLVSLISPRLHLALTLLPLFYDISSLFPLSILSPLSSLPVPPFLTVRGISPLQDGWRTLCGWARRLSTTTIRKCPPQSSAARRRWT